MAPPDDMPLDGALEQPRSHTPLLIALMAGIMMGALDIGILGPAMPAMQHAFDVGERDVSWIYTIYVLFNLVGTPLWAKLSDLWGRRRVFLIDVAIFALGSLVVATAPGGWVGLLVGRALQGFGVGGFFPVATATVGDTFPPEQRGRVLGLFGAAFGLAFVMGPILGGVLLRYGWPILFLINLPVAVVVFIAAAWALPSAVSEHDAPFDVVGLAALATSLACLTYGISQLDTASFTNSLTSLRCGPFLLVATVLVPVFLWLESRAVDPILRPQLIARRPVALSCVLAAGAGFVEAGVVYLPVFAVVALTLTDAQAAFELIPIVVAVVISSPPAGLLVDRLGARVVVLGGLTLVMVGYALFGTIGDSTLGFRGSGAVLGLGLGMLLGPPIRTVLLNEASAQERGAAQGLFTLFASTGRLMSGALTGAIVASQGGGIPGFKAAFLTVASVALALHLVAAVLRPTPLDQVGGNT